LACPYALLCDGKDSIQAFFQGPFLGRYAESDARKKEAPSSKNYKPATRKTADINM
jgi:hypothetical protein